MQRESVNRTMGGLEWGMLLLLSVLWGGSFFFNEIAIGSLPTFTVVVVRVVLAALVLLVFLKLRGIALPMTREIIVAFFCMGLLNNVIPFTLIVWGQIHIASGVASILNATTPVFTVIVAHYMTSDERMTRGRLAGVVLGFLGVASMIGFDAIRELGSNLVAQLAVLGGALSYAFAGVYGRRFKRLGVDPIATATGQVTASSVLLVPLMLAVDKPWTLSVPGTSAVLALAGVAVLSTALAYVIYFQLLARAGATNLLLVTFLIPVSAILLGIGFLDEILETRHLVGMALISGGLAAIDGRLFRRG